MFRLARRAKARRARRLAHRFGELTGRPVAASEMGRPESHDQPFRREVRPHGGAQPSRGHWREAPGWISDLDGISVLDRNTSRSFGTEMWSRIERGFGLRREEAVPDRTRLRLRERGNTPGRGGRLPKPGLEWHCHFGANPERARPRSNFLGVLRVMRTLGGRRAVRSQKSDI